MNIVLIGAGLAGASAADELRAQGYTGDITLIGAEPHPPYERPPLSKGILLGSAEPDSVFVHPEQWYADHQVELVTGSPVTELHLDTGHVLLGERRLPYDRLLLATGARPRHLHRDGRAPRGQDHRRSHRRTPAHARPDPCRHRSRARRPPR